jgi:hypothetical protein
MADVNTMVVAQRCDGGLAAFISRAAASAPATMAMKGESPNWQPAGRGSVALANLSNTVR